MEKVTNITVAGLGGQGVLKVTDILAEGLFAAGYDVKKSDAVTARASEILWEKGIQPHGSGRGI